MADTARQSGFIITKLDDGSYAYTMTSVGAGLDDQQMQDLLASFGDLEPGVWCHINLALDVDGQAVVVLPVRMIPEEEALYI